MHVPGALANLVEAASVIQCMVVRETLPDYDSVTDEEVSYLHLIPRGCAKTTLDLSIRLKTSIESQLECKI